MLEEDLQKQRKAIREAMRYAVPDEHLSEAEELLEIYRDDRIALILLKEFYSFLPEAQEDWIKELRLVNRQQGIFLLAALTGKSTYLYVVSSEGIEFAGRAEDGFIATELLDFFGYEDLAAFTACCTTLQDLPEYESTRLDAELCPACHAASGEYHELGCPVELCPWCGGQLIHCSCRYEHLGLDAISSEQDLLQLEQLLEERGRIPYSPEQRPHFADEGPGVLFE